MKGDFTRKSLQTAKSYTKVLLQQGRVTLDADWNEQADIAEQLARAASMDVLGPSGASLEGGGFKVLASPSLGTTDFALQPGRITVAGLACETGEAVAVVAVAANAGNTPNRRLVLDRPALDGTKLSALVGKLVEVQAVRHDGTVAWTGGASPAPVRAVYKVTAGSDGPGNTACSIDVDGDVGAELRDRLHDERLEVRRVHTFTDQPFRTPAAALANPAPAGKELVYLDVWQRHVTALEDPSLREVALGGPDTATRVQTVWQVRTAPANAAGCDSLAAIAANTGLFKDRLSRGRLSASHKASQQQQPCDVGETGGYTGLENALYRVEVHKPGDIGTATFKWSRDNGSVCFRVTKVRDPLLAAPNRWTLDVERLGRDDVLNLRPGDWVELTTLADELAPGPGLMAQVATVDDARLRVEVDLVAGQTLGPHKALLDDPALERPLVRLRRWDQRTEGEAEVRQTGDERGTIRTSASIIPLELGVEVRFHGDNFLAGDHWLIPARTAGQTAGPLVRAPPLGVQRHRCPLALIERASATWSADAAKNHDCRPLFMPLTADHRRLRPSGGDGQEAGPGLELPSPVSVAVEDRWGRPVPLAKVLFSVTEGGGQVKGDAAAFGATAEATTDADGIASVLWMMGAWGKQAVKATLPAGHVPHNLAPPAPVIIRANARLRMRVLGGDGQEGRAGTSLPCPLAVIVEDPHGRPPASQVGIAFTASAGSILPAAPTTAAGTGIAEVAWTMPADAEAGPCLTADAAFTPAGGPTLRCRLKAQIRPKARTVRIAGGDGQSGVGGQRLPCPLAVVVEDEWGCPVTAGVSVTFAAATGSGRLATTPTGAPAGSTATVTAPTAGSYKVWWTPGNRDGSFGECQSVEAFVVDPPQDPDADDGDELRAVFRAHVLEPQPADDRPVRIEAINWTHRGNVQLAGLLKDGLVVTFSDKIDDRWLQPEDFVVELEQPVVEQDMPGRRPFQVVGTSTVSGKTWTFRPRLDGPTLQSWQTEGTKLELGKRAGVLCRVRILKGGMLDENDAPLLGPALARILAEDHGKKGPAWTRVRDGSAFETWFYLQVPAKTRTPSDATTTRDTVRERRSPLFRPVSPP